MTSNVNDFEEQIVYYRLAMHVGACRKQVFECFCVLKGQVSHGSILHTHGYFVPGAFMDAHYFLKRIQSQLNVYVK